MSITQTADRTLIGRPLRTTFAQRDDMVPFAGRLMADPTKAPIKAPTGSKSFNCSSTLSSELSSKISCRFESSYLRMSFCPCSFTGSSSGSVVPVVVGSLFPFPLPPINRFSVSGIPAVMLSIPLFITDRAQIVDAGIRLATSEAKRAELALLIALSDSALTRVTGNAFRRAVDAAPDAKPFGFSKTVFSFFRHEDSMGQGVYPVKPKDQPKWAKTIPIEIKG